MVFTREKREDVTKDRSSHPNQEAIQSTHHCRAAKGTHEIPRKG